MKGEDIEVVLKKPGLGDKQVKVSGEGNNLIVRNGERIWKIEGEKLYTNRKGGKGDVFTEIANERDVNKRVESSGEGSEIVDKKTEKAYVRLNKEIKTAPYSKTPTVSIINAIDESYRALPDELVNDEDKLIEAIVILGYDEHMVEEQIDKLRMEGVLLYSRSEPKGWSLGNY